MPTWLFLLSQIKRQLWLTVALYSVGGMVVALLAALLAPWVPEDFAITLGTRAVDDVLTILASSMLTVATFSLAVFVTAYTAMSGAASPRAAALLVSDGRGHGALATFVGAFIYAIVGIFALQTGYYGEQGRVIVFLFTMVVLGAVVAALLRWVDQLSRMGRVEEAIDRVAEATSASFDSPWARRLWPPRVSGTEPSLAVYAGEVGYVRNIDLERLRGLASELNCVIDVEALPGDFVHVAAPILRLAGRQTVEKEMIPRLRRCWVIGDRRTFDQDPRFGMSVLGEIAAKALSPGLNDPGTALDVVSTAVRLLSQWAKDHPPERLTAHDCLRLRSLAAGDLLDEVFTPIAQYGAGNATVALHLQAAFAALCDVGDPELAIASRASAALARTRALAALQMGDDRKRLRRAARRFERRSSARRARQQYDRLGS